MPITDKQRILLGGIGGASAGALLTSLIVKKKRLQKILLGAAVGGGLGTGGAYLLGRQKPGAEPIVANNEDRDKLAESIWHRMMYDSVIHGGNGDKLFPARQEGLEQYLPKFYSGVFRNNPAKGWIATYEVTPDRSDYKITISPGKGYIGEPITITKDSFK